MVKTTISFLMLSILFLSMVSAVGVANSYWDDKPLKLAKGESTTISLRLQNEETEAVMINVSLDSPIAELVDGTEYEVPPGKISVPVYLKISIPKDAELGTTYIVPVDFKQITSGNTGGFFRVAQGITGKVPVEVVGEEESEIYGQSKGLSMFWIVGIVLVLVLGVLVYVNRRRHRNISPQ